MCSTHNRVKWLFLWLQFSISFGICHFVSDLVFILGWIKSGTWNSKDYSIVRNLSSSSRSYGSILGWGHFRDGKKRVDLWPFKQSVSRSPMTVKYTTLHLNTRLEADWTTTGRYRCLKTDTNSLFESKPSS